MKAVDPGYAGFGEAYFSMVDRGAVKGWKRHHAHGAEPGGVRGRDPVLRAGREDGWAGSVVLSPEADDSHARLTVPAGMLDGVRGCGRGRQHGAQRGQHRTRSVGGGNGADRDGSSCYAGETIA